MDRGQLGLGVVCGMGAGALWGLVFLAPELARQFTPFQLSVGRYLAYGGVAAVLIAPRWRKLSASLGAPEWWALMRLSLLGNLLYYVLLASAVQLSGMAMVSLIIGFLPVAVMIVGSRATGAVPLAKLAPSMLLAAAGLGIIGGDALRSVQAGASLAQVGGLLCAFGALATWTAYAIGNSRWLARLGHVSSNDWSLLTGVVAGGQALVLGVPAFLFDGADHAPGQWAVFVAVVAGLAILASIVGNALWNRVSRLLPLTLAGQMILFETLFALLYAFLWEDRLPSAAEALSIALVCASVISCIAAHQPARATPGSS